ncbi:PTS IIA-like nitrogen regulatory protein PtsN [Craurococcus roseus]|uniref:PTS IIA-like nitrogen regulatory protein PtsN n=1 Tax=Craurococcus roseus TaxID=77585 RepID=A0ABN1FRD0_9PROT
MWTPDHLAAADVILDLEAATKQDVLRLLSKEAAGRLGRPEREVLGALAARERLGSTALGRGVALPHARLAGYSPPLVLIVRLRRPVDFEARDEEPVDLVILVLWPEASPEGFLPALSGIVGTLRDPQVLRRLRRARTPAEAASLLRGGAAAPAGRPLAPGAG